ncbi:MAG: phosphodiester glycosidase family protein [Akkermansiaceae bacterium]|nr:phosphodiester glycosidase family protein [Akkermansiaceae bacterium]
MAIAEESVAPEKKVIDGVGYHILEVKPEQVKILWKGDDDKPLRTFPEAAKYLETKGTPAQVLCNGGIFEPGGIPSGLMVQDGKQLQPINRKDGEGNFFLKPNGVFLVGPKGAMVMDATQYPPQGVAVTHAVQSGPLLLSGGKIHPKFNPKSKWRLIRNGVGVTKDGKVVLAMTDFHSEKLPTLWEFAKLFQSLGCDDALFLDGDLSQMRSSEDLKERSNRFGSIIAVVAAPEKKP